MTNPFPRVDQAPTRVGALRRHFADLRDSRHGDSAVTREEKEARFRATVPLIDPYAREVLQELDEALLLGTGHFDATGVVRTSDGGLIAVWSLSWPAQEEAGVDPIRLVATYGADFHHPHLRGGTVGEWTLNVFTAEQAAAERPILGAIAEAELHNLVFRADYRIVPATTAHTPRVGTGFIR